MLGLLLPQALAVCKEYYGFVEGKTGFSSWALGIKGSSKTPAALPLCPSIHGLARCKRGCEGGTEGVELKDVTVENTRKYPEPGVEWHWLLPADHSRALELRSYCRKS